MAAPGKTQASAITTCTLNTGRVEGCVAADEGALASGADRADDDLERGVHRVARRVQDALAAAHVDNPLFDQILDLRHPAPACSEHRTGTVPAQSALNAAHSPTVDARV